MTHFAGPTISLPSSALIFVKVQKGMSALAMCLHSKSRLGHIFCMSNYAEVIGPHTVAHSTKVVNFHSFWYGMVPLLERNSVSVHSIKNSVSTIIYCSLPEPATFCNLNFSHELFKAESRDHTMLYHAIILFTLKFYRE